MTRLALFVLVSISFAAPALAQVINGETPLDETPLHRETTGSADQTRAPPAEPSSAPEDEPARRDMPQTAPRRD